MHYPSVQSSEAKLLIFGSLDAGVAIHVAGVARIPSAPVSRKAVLGPVWPALLGIGTLAFFSQLDQPSELGSRKKRGVAELGKDLLEHDASES